MSAPASDPSDPAGSGAIARPDRRSLKARTADRSSAEAAALERERWMRRIQKVKERNEAEHQRALRDQREQLNRLHDVQLRRLRRDHDDDLRRVRMEARSSVEQLRAQLSELQRLSCHHRGGPAQLTAELAQLRNEKQQLQRQLQEVVESGRRDCESDRKTGDTCENEPRKNEKPNKNEERSEESPTAGPTQREAQLQRQVQQLQAAVKALLTTRSRRRRRLEKRIRKMESEQKPSRLRAKRSVARLLQNRARADAKTTAAAEKPAAPGETRLPKPVCTRPPLPSKRRKPSAPSSDSSGEVIQLKRKVEELQKCIEQLRETAQNRTNRLGTLHTQRPHRLLQGKMSELPTLREDERLDSLEEATTDDRSSDISDIKPSDLAALSREELRQLCCQLQRAHQQLRQAHELMVARVRESGRPGRARSRVENELLASQSLVRDLEAALATKGVDPSALQEKSVLTAQNLCLTQKLRDLRAREVKVKNELQELRDLNELMEFRILELEGCQEKSGDRASPVPPADQSRPNSSQRNDDTGAAASGQTLEAAGEDRRHSAVPAAIAAAPAPALPPPPEHQLSEERHHWQEKIAELQSTILQLEAALEEAGSHQLSASVEAKSPASPAPPVLTSGHQRQPSGNSESELSDYHSDSNDGQSARRSPTSSSGGCLCGGRLSARPLTSPDHPGPLQESGIFDVDVDEKAVQTEIQESEVSMRELIDLTSEIARLTSVQEQLERSPLPITSSRARHTDDSERTEETGGECTAESDQQTVLPVPLQRTVSVCAEAQTEYVHDQLLCDYRDMCERYEKVKKTYETVQDEKNELEEAENDARLMVQRLEMKIFASNEVEKMLSSDLADEQERCRQLQRQLNSVKLKHQADLKARQAQAAELPAQMSERVQQLEREVQQLTERLQQEAARRAPSEHREQQTEAMPGAWQLWRASEGSSSDTLSSAEPTAASGSDTSLPPPETPSSGVNNTESLTRRLDQAWSFNDSGMGEELSRSSAPDSEVAPSTAKVAPPAARPAKRPRTESEEQEEEEDQSSATLSSDVTMCTECTKRMGDMETMESPKNSMDSNLSERESYYSECIQELETQKCELRKRWEEEKTSMLKQVEDTCQESGELKRKMEEILRDGESAKESLSKKVAQLKLELREQAMSSERDRNELIQSHTMKTQSLQEQQVLLKRRMRAAEDVLNALKVEFDLCQVDSGRESPADPCFTLVLDRVRHLHQSQKDLATQVSELEKKEGAYRETLQEADRIMHNVEIRYQKKIEELEDQLREDKNKITLMEETESKLKQALKSVSNGKHDKDRVTELLDKLIETENEDLKLKEKVYRLERRERELSIRLREEERAAEGLRHELRDQEELLRELDTARRELSAATEQLSVLPALRQRAAELQQSEEFLRGRIEELEQAELSLQDTLRNTRNAQAHKERRAAEQVSSLQQDVESLQASVQELQLAATDSGEERCKLRRELQEARRQLQDVHRDLETTSGTANETETQFRNEVCKLRNQLSLVNSQLNDNDSYSCQLRDQLERTQSENAELRAALDGCKSRSEQDVLQLNLEISRREEEISALSEQLAELDKSQLTGELDVLAEQENTLVKLLALAKQSNDKIQNCEQCTSEVDGALRSVIQELEQLTLLLSGSQGDQSLQSQLRDAENLASAAAALTSQPVPARRPELLDTAVQTADQPAPEEGACCAELRQELAAKEEELSLVDGQGAYLQAELEQRERESRQLRGRLGDTDALLEHQRLQHGRLSELLAQAQFARDEAAARADGKDALLGAVLRHLRAVLEAHQAAALVRALRESEEHQSDRQDLDREMVCQILQQIVTVMRERVLRSRSSRNSSPDQAGAGSRIPRPVPRSRESTPPSSPRKDLPRSKAPVPRCLQPKRTARQMPPVGVARPYRSTPSTAEVRDRPHARLAPHKAVPSPALPPPENFQIIRAVGGDSLLIYWSPSDDQRITGYQIFVNNRLQQVIRNPQRTKALLPSLRLASQLQLAIRAVGPLDSVSALSWAEYRPGQMAASSRHRGQPVTHPVTT